MHLKGDLEQMSETNNTLNNENVPLIKVNDLHKSFGKHEVLKGISTAINKGDVVAIICLLYTSTFSDNTQAFP